MPLKKREELEAREAVDIARMARKGAGSLAYVVMILVAASVLFIVELEKALVRRWRRGLQRGW